MLCKDIAILALVAILFSGAERCVQYFVKWTGGSKILFKNISIILALVAILFSLVEQFVQFWQRAL